MATDTDRTPGDGALVRNPVSLTGAWITTLSVFAFLTYLMLEQLGLLASPYSGLFGFVLVPLVFVLGLLLIPIGIWREGRRRRRGEAAWRWPSIDLGSARTRTVLITVAALTLVNLSILAIAAVGAAEYSESNEFCGQTCHVPMEPEYVSHRLSPHSRTDCVSCHVGPGATGAVTAKLNGTRQLYHLLGGSYSRPIPSARDRMPVPLDTCEGCHAPVPPDKQTVRTFTEYDDDETSSVWSTTTLTMYTGKNHWHARPDVVVEYIATDETLEEIPYIKVTEGGEVTEYLASETESRPEGTLRRMDCLDCHNRPAHQMTDPPEVVVDRAIERGVFDPAGLPFARRELVAAISDEYPDGAEARQGITARLQEAFGQGPRTAEAIALAERLYATNVFPAMKVTWGTYKNQLSHPDGSGGCLRCHDDDHMADRDEERVVRQDCELCHLEQ
jgi:nitrate/TMAO reductase-like tetraheme cytochrome c subunit